MIWSASLLNQIDRRAPPPQRGTQHPVALSNPDSKVDAVAVGEETARYSRADSQGKHDTHRDQVSRRGRNGTRPCDEREDEPSCEFSRVDGNFVARERSGGLLSNF